MSRRDAVGILGIGAVVGVGVAVRDALVRCPAGTYRTEYGCQPPCGPGAMRQGSLTSACLPAGGPPPATPEATPVAAPVAAQVVR